MKRALRAIDSPAYTKARSKNPLLPEITATIPKTEIFKLLPLSLLALRVSKSDPHEGHGHAPSKPQKRAKGLWTVKIEQQQDINDDLHYVWLYEGPQWRTKLYAAGALILIMTIVMFPLWPVKLRIGVWYLSMAFLGLLGLFFAMAIFRLILFCVTVFTVPPGLWLYPNLFEDVGFFDSFRPVWGWQEVSPPSGFALPIGRKGGETDCMAMSRTRRPRNRKSRRREKRGRKRMLNQKSRLNLQTGREQQQPMGKSPSGMRMLRRELRRWKMSKNGSGLLANYFIHACAFSYRCEHYSVWWFEGVI